MLRPSGDGDEVEQPLARRGQQYAARCLDVAADDHAMPRPLLARDDHLRVLRLSAQAAGDLACQFVMRTPLGRDRADIGDQNRAALGHHHGWQTASRCLGRGSIA